MVNMDIIIIIINLLVCANELENTYSITGDDSNRFYYKSNEWRRVVV